jgi:DNA-binding transcriptional MocR family regulator
MASRSWEPRCGFLRSFVRGVFDICYSTDLVSELKQYRICGKGAKEIAASVERAIEEGSLSPGDPLPAVRRFAAELQVSPTTVAAAFADLRSRGLVVTRERSRSYVSWRPPVAGGWLGSSVPAGARDLASGNPDPALLPNLKPFLRRMEPPSQLYGGEPVDPRLLRLAEAEFAGTGIGSDDITVVSGALDGIERTLQAHLRPGDVVAVEDPGYAGLFDLLRALGLALRPVPIDAKGMIPASLGEALKEGVAAVVVNPRGQNPTGASLDKARAKELRCVLESAPEALILEDDHLGPIAGAPRVTLAEGRSRWAAALSVAKSLGPDIRLALLAGDAQTISRVRGRQAIGPHWVSHLLQRLVAMLWSDADVTATLERTAGVYGERRKGLVRALAERGIKARSGAGITVWVPVSEEAPVVQSLLERGWAVSAGAPYRLQSERAVRITISTLKEREADKLAEAIEDSLRPTRRSRTA